MTPRLFRQIFGDFLRGARDRRGLVQTELADLSGVSQAMISQIEKGEKDFTSDVVEKLIEGLQIDTVALCDQLAIISHAAPISVDGPVPGTNTHAGARPSVSGRAKQKKARVLLSEGRHRRPTRKPRA